MHADLDMHVYTHGYAPQSPPAMAGQVGPSQPPTADPLRQTTDALHAQEGPAGGQGSLDAIRVMMADGRVDLQVLVCTMVMRHNFLPCSRALTPYYAHGP